LFTPEASMYVPANAYPSQNGHLSAYQNSDGLSVSTGEYLNYSLWIKPDWGSNTNPVNFFHHECYPNKRTGQVNYYENFVSFYYDSETYADALFLYVVEQWDNGNTDYVDTYRIEEFWSFPVSGINQSITGISPSNSGRGSWSSGGFVNIQIEYANRFQSTGTGTDNDVVISWNNQSLNGNPVSRTYFINGVGQFPIPSNVAIDFRNFAATNLGTYPATINIGSTYFEGGYWIDKFMFDPNALQWTGAIKSNIYGNGSPGTYTSPGTVVYYDFNTVGNWYDTSSGTVSATNTLNGNPNPNQDNTNYVS